MRFPDTAAAHASSTDTGRIAQHRHFLMCRPEHFTVSYEINPWMDRSAPPDTALAMRQWQRLHETYVALGHDVDLIEPIAGLPDMVYTANGAFTVDGRALGARFHVPQRRGEERPHRDWLAERGFTVVETRSAQEGEGDLLLVGDTILAGYGFRSHLASHAEVSAIFGLEVISLRLVNPWLYHLDTALCVLDPVQGPGGVERANIAWLPDAFDEPSRARILERFPDAIRIPDDEGAVLGLNAVSDGRHVLISPPTPGFDAQLRERGYLPVHVDLSELLLGGGGIKCCTLELRGGPS